MATARPATPPIQFDVGPPEWMANMAKNYQATEDRRYALDLVDFHSSVDDWAQRASIAAQLPGAQLPVPPPIPTRAIFGVKDNTLQFYIWQDPTLAIPTPPVIHTTPSSNSIKATPSVANAQAGPDQIAELLRMVTQIFDALQAAGVIPARVA